MTREKNADIPLTFNNGTYYLAAACVQPFPMHVISAFKCESTYYTFDSNNVFDENNWYKNGAFKKDPGCYVYIKKDKSYFAKYIKYKKKYLNLKHIVNNK